MRTEDIKEWIKLEDCIHGYLYRIDSRRLDGVGVFDASVKGFVGVRQKFSLRFLFTEYHWDTGAPYGTVKPLELIEECPHKVLTWTNDELFKWLETKGIPSGV